MKKPSKNKAGRPSRYKDEQTVRIGAAVRPRYREALELIAKYRNCTLSEAIEFAAAYLANNYFIEHKKAIDYVCNRDEIYIDCMFCFSVPKTSEESNKQMKGVLEWIDKYNKSPKSLITPQDNFIFTTYEFVMDYLNCKSTYYLAANLHADVVLLNEFILSYRQQAIDITEIATSIYKMMSYIHFQINKDKNSPYHDKNIPVSHRLTYYPIDTDFLDWLRELILEENVKLATQSNNDDKSS